MQHQLNIYVYGHNNTPLPQHMIKPFSHFYKLTQNPCGWGTIELPYFSRVFAALPLIFARHLCKRKKNTQKWKIENFQTFML